MENETAEGRVGSAVPLSVFRLSQSAPLRIDALQLRAVVPETLIRNEPAELPGRLPVGAVNCAPDGNNSALEEEEINKVTGTDAGPAELVMLIAVW